MKQYHQESVDLKKTFTLRDTLRDDTLRTRERWEIAQAFLHGQKDKEDKGSQWGRMEEELSGQSSVLKLLISPLNCPTKKSNRKARAQTVKVV